MMLKNGIKTIVLASMPTIYTKWVYRQIFGKRLDLKKPEGFNERILRLKLVEYRRNPLVVRCADKHRMREYASNPGLTHNGYRYVETTVNTLAVVQS